MPRRLRPAAWIILACAAALSACTAVGGAPADEPPGAASPADPEARGPSARPTSPFCAPDAPRYLAFLASGTCADVGGSGGTWLARQLFPDAPADVRQRACGYQWRADSAVRADDPDVEALEALGPDLLTASREPPPPCEDPVSLRGTATLVPPPAPDGGADGAPTGVSGCDVCARLRDGSVFVILPADLLELKTAVVTTESGRYVTVDIQPPTRDAQAFSFDLPPAPDGAAYEDGRVPLFAKPL